MKKTLLILIASLLLALALVGCGEDTPPTAAQNATATATQQPAYQLALTDGNYATPSTAMVAQYQKVLNSLQSKTGDEQIVIADDTLKGLTDLMNHSISDTLLQLMQAVDLTISGHPTYADALAALIAVLENPR